jgi:ADP-heptose:LPS heptosyltransferase
VAKRTRVGYVGGRLENPRSILVIKPSSLGDVVHTLPAVACVKRRWPDARLTWLVNPEWAPLLRGNPDIDDILEFPRSQFRGLGGLLRFMRTSCWISRVFFEVDTWRKRPAARAGEHRIPAKVPAFFTSTS